MPKGIATFLIKFESRIEIILWIFFMITLAFLYLKTESAFIGIGISMTNLSIFYFLMAFVPLNETQAIKIIASKVVNIGSSVSITGIMYKLMSLLGADIMMNVGLIAMIISGGILILKSLNNWTDKTTRLAVRLILIVVIGFAL